eukprot:scaffold66434_cov14-Prasinocladus_malaysianus.AAC.1
MLHSLDSVGSRSPDFPDRRRAPSQLTSRHRLSKHHYYEFVLLRFRALELCMCVSPVATDPFGFQLTV